MHCLNLGCGDRFHPDWINLDFYSNTPAVKAHNLIEGIPYANQSFDVVYHSHLLEHFPASLAYGFLTECKRVLKPGGVLRVAVPDLEQICRLYLESLQRAVNNEEGWQYNYEWMLLEMYDQTVRNQSGGQMLKYLLQEPILNENFIEKRLGSFYKNLKVGIDSIKKNSASLRDEKNFTDEQVGKFRRAGEVHQCMYDRYSLKQLLEKADFVQVIQRSAHTSFISDWQTFNLDTDSNGAVYKADSLYMEGRKRDE